MRHCDLVVEPWGVWHPMEMAPLEDDLLFAMYPHIKALQNEN